MLLWHTPRSQRQRELLPGSRLEADYLQQTTAPSVTRYGYRRVRVSAEAVSAIAL
jgi:hypothetical protein